MSSTVAAPTQRRDRVAGVSYPSGLTATPIQGRHHRRVVKGTVMPPMITSDVVVAYAQCPRKAYKLLYTDTQGIPHVYLAILEEEARKNRANHMQKLLGKVCVHRGSQGLAELTPSL